MTPKEKAFEIYSGFEYYVQRHNILNPPQSMTPRHYQKQCALMVVDEVLEALDIGELWDIKTLQEARNKRMEYWEQVEQEIQML